VFPEVLRRIRGARARRPGRADVHLATNGMLLTPARGRELVDLGVTSVMVSLDGATAPVNDRIRVGGAFNRVIDHLRAAVALRTAGADLRVGVSVVLGRSNAHQVEGLATLAIDLGLDWLKLEETWPATPFARLDALPADAVAEAIAAVAPRLAAAGVVLVDHVDPPAACACSGDPRAIAFRSADDHAHRFRHRACRAAWEQAAIDPDGTVHLGDYGGPALGSLLGAELLALWNGPAARAARASALVGSSAAARARCAAS
jgi:cyclomaltodextrinase